PDDLLGTAARTNDHQWTRSEELAPALPLLIHPPRRPNGDCTGDGDGGSEGRYRPGCAAHEPDEVHERQSETGEHDRRRQRSDLVEASVAPASRVQACRDAEHTLGDHGHDP